jgi:hypothetical protein
MEAPPSGENSFSRQAEPDILLVFLRHCFVCLEALENYFSSRKRPRGFGFHRLADRGVTKPKLTLLIN